jgi:uncharacterized protein (TIGR02145 family)
VKPSTNITAEPDGTDPAPICHNTTDFPQLSVTANGDNLSYQWYINTAQSTDGTAVTDSVNNTFTPTSNLTAGDYYYYCIVTGDCGMDTSAFSGKHTVKPTTEITTEPATTIPPATCFNTDDFPQLSITAVGDNLTYQWYRNSTATTTGGIAITDSTNTTLTPTSNLPAGNYYYYCIVSGDCGKDTSAFSGRHTINPILVPTIAIDGKTKVCEGEPVTFASTIRYGGTNPQRQWYVNNTAVPLAIGATFTYTPDDGDIIRCELISNAICAEPTLAISNNITMTVVAYPLAPVLLTDTLSAFKGMPIDLSTAVDMLPGLIYTFYANADLTGRINGSVVIFNPPKDDYYVTATFEGCEGAATQIILKDPCPETVSDEETNEYKVTSLAGYCWTENLKTTLIPGTTNPIPFAKVYTCAGCPDHLDDIFGLLYTWYSAMGDPTRATHVQGICPDGWHIPSQTEWNALSRFPAAQLKSTNYWLDPPGSGTDDFGFDARPAGWYNSAINRYEDLYGFAGWWAADAPTTGTTTATTFYLNYYCDVIQNTTKNKGDGMSVRCVWNNE